MSLEKFPSYPRSRPTSGLCAEAWQLREMKMFREKTNFRPDGAGPSTSSPPPPRPCGEEEASNNNEFQLPRAKKATRVAPTAPAERRRAAGLHASAAKSCCTRGWEKRIGGERRQGSGGEQTTDFSPRKRGRTSSESAAEAFGSYRKTERVRNAGMHTGGKGRDRTHRRTWPPVLQKVSNEFDGQGSV